MRYLIIDRTDLSIANCISLCASIFAIIGIIVLYTHTKAGLALVLCSLVCDILDGWLARRYPSNSKLGAILDSFTDIVLYVVPICIITILYYGLSVITVGIICIFIASSLLRLSIFTNNGFEKDIEGLRHYVGMPVYFNHLLILLCIGQFPLLFVIMGFVLSSWLMISKYRFTKFELYISVLRVAMLGLIGYLFLVK